MATAIVPLFSLSANAESQEEIDAAMAAAEAAADSGDAGTDYEFTAKGAEEAYTGSDSNSDVFFLGQSVVTAAGYSQSVREAPASISILTPDDIKESSARDIGDMVANLPGIEISKSKTGGSNVMIRGFDSGYTLLMVDGKRQNPTSAYVKNGFDPNTGFTPPSSMIERIEVVRGPASTLYGSDAIGGAINIITKKHPDKVTGSIGFESTIQEHTKYGNGGGTNASIMVPVLDNMLSFNLRGRYYEKDNTELKDPKGSYLSHSANDFDLKNLGGRIVYTPVKGHDIYVDAEQYRMTAGAMSTSALGIPVIQNYRKTQATLNYDGEYNFGTINSYGQYIKYETLFPNYDYYDETYVLETKAITPFNFANGQALNLTTGIQYWQDRFRDDSGLVDGALPVAISGKDLVHNMTSLYAEGEYFMTDSLIGTVGARYTYSDLFGSHVTPRAYLVYKATDNLTFKSGVAAGYKTPSAKELQDGVFQQDTFGAVPLYGNPDLKPETSVNYELSMLYELPRVGSFTLTGFLTDFNDKLNYDDYDIGQTMSNGVVCDPLVVNNSSKCRVRSNVGKTRSHGVELLFSTAKYHGFSAEGSYTYTKHVYNGGTNDGKNVSSIPRHSVMTKLKYDHDNYGMFLKATGKFRTPYVSTRGGASFDYYKNYVLLDLGGYYQFSKNARLNVTVNNLLDFNAYDSFDEVTSSRGTSYNTYYRDYIEGRNLYVNFTYDF